MKLNQFVDTITLALLAADERSPVIVIDRKAGKTFTIKEIELDMNQGGDGSQTVWIEVEED